MDWRLRSVQRKTSQSMIVVSHCCCLHTDETNRWRSNDGRNSFDKADSDECSQSIDGSKDVAVPWCRFRARSEGMFPRLCCIVDNLVRSSVGSFSAVHCSVWRSQHTFPRFPLFPIFENVLSKRTRRRVFPCLNRDRRSVSYVAMNGEQIFQLIQASIDTITSFLFHVGFGNLNDETWATMLAAVSRAYLARTCRNIEFFNVDIASTCVVHGDCFRYV